MLLRELDIQTNLLSSASNCIYDERDHRYIDHSVKELLTQRVFQIAAGYEDCDDTNNDTYGQQELALFNNYYNEYCYMPLHIYEGLSGKLIATILKPGRRDKQANIARLLRKLISYLRVQWPDTKIIVRGDSHFASQDFMDWTIIQPNVDFITGLTGNAKLHELAQVTIESA